MAEDADAAESFASVVSGGTFVFFGFAFHMAASFGTQILLARSFDAAEYGAISVGYTLLLVLTTVAMVGLQTGLGRFLPRVEGPRARRGLLRTAAYVVVPTATAVGLAVTGAADVVARAGFHDPSVAPIVALFGAAIPFAAVVRLAVGASQGLTLSAPKVVLEQVSIPLLRLVFVVVVLVLGLAAEWVAAAYLLTYVLTAAVGVYFLARHTPLLGGGSELRFAELVSFSAPLVVAHVMRVSFSHMDKLMLGYFTTLSATGTYSAMYTLGFGMTVALLSLRFLTMPVLSDHHSDGEYDAMQSVYATVTKWGFLATVPILFVFVTFSTELVGFVFGPGYLDGARALAVLSFGFFVHSVVGPNGAALTAIGRTRTVMYCDVCGMAVNAGLNLVLIPRYSFLGAAAATTASYAVLNGLYAHRLYRHTGIHPFRRSFLRVAVAVAGLGCAGYLAADVVPPGGLSAATVLVVFLVAYLPTALATGGVDDAELALVRRLGDRFGVDVDPTLERLSN